MPAFDDDVWELYGPDDWTQAHDLAAEQPEKLQELIDLWWREAERNHVLPLDNRPYAAIMEPGPTGIPHRDRYVYWRSGARVAEEVAADVKGRSHRIEAHVEIPGDGAEGVLLAMGSILGGYSLFVADDRLQYVHNYLGREEHHLSSSIAIPSGSRKLGFEFDAEGMFKGGSSRLTIDGEVVAEGEIPRYTPVRWSITDAGQTCGEDAGSAVTPRYEAPFRFTGTLHRVVVDVSGDTHVDPDEAVESKLRTQ
jgi:arylsulfatase